MLFESGTEDELRKILPKGGKNVNRNTGMQNCDSNFS